MSDTQSPHFGFDYLTASQAQKHVVVNDVIRDIDSFMHLSVKANALTQPPTSPANGDRYLIGQNAIDDWAGKDGQLAFFHDDGWVYFEPQIGWRIWDEANFAFRVYTSSGWHIISGSEEGDEDVYLPIDGIAVDSHKLGGKSASNYALASDVSALLPSGVILPFAGGAIPAGFLLCNGAALSRTSYATLFAAIGTTYGRGNGSTTFNLPDLRGEFIRGADNGRGVDNGRALGSSQRGSQIFLDDGNNSHSTHFGGSADVDRLYSDYYQHANKTYDPYDGGGRIWHGVYGYNTDPTKLDKYRTSVSYYWHMRPRNIALNYIIKY